MAYGQGPMMQDGDGVHISKAENGYMVTLFPALKFEAMQMPFMFEKPEPHQISEMKEAHQKSKPRVFVFSNIDDAWSAIKEFLLDGRMPKGQ